MYQKENFIKKKKIKAARVCKRKESLFRKKKVKGNIFDI